MDKTINDKYKDFEQIGRGSYAVVYKAIRRDTGQTFAIKQIPASSDWENLKNEITILSACKCENIIEFIESSYDKDKDKDKVSIVMEYCCVGSVKDVMRRLNRSISEDQIIVITRDVVNGLSYLDSKGKIHRDVKAANILLNEQGVAKLGDLGVSESSKASSKGSIIGTLLWLPPEVVNKSEELSSVIDIWSLGITIIEMGDGQPPYSDLDPSMALSEIGNMDEEAPTFQERAIWSHTLLNFLDLCLVKDPSKRKRASELLAHDLFKARPSRGVVRKLVYDVCVKNPKLDIFIRRKRDELFYEISKLYARYEQQRMTVVKVDKVTDTMKTILKEYYQLLESIRLHDKEVNELRKESKQITCDVQALERERNDLRAAVEGHNRRKRDILDQIGKIRYKWSGSIDPQNGMDSLPYEAESRTLN